MFLTVNMHRPTAAKRLGFLLAVAAALLAPLYLICISFLPVRPGDVEWLATGPFVSACMRSLIQVVLLTGLTLPLGMIIGLLYALAASRLRQVTLFLLVLPVMLPPFLWSIGWSSLRRFFAYRHQFWFDGLPGSLLTFATPTVPLIALATIVGVHSLSSTHIGVARLAGGPLLLLRLFARYALPLAASVAVLASIFAVADPGAAQIMGFHGAASTILMDFSARHDFNAAALKTCFYLVFLLAPTVLFGYWAASRVKAELSGVEVAHHKAALPSWWSRAAGAAASVLAAGTLLPPTVGILYPLARTTAGQIAKFILPAVSGTAGTTVFYSATAGFVAAILGLFMAICVAPDPKGRGWLLLLACCVISVPPSLNALGVIALTTHLPGQLDFISRSGWSVGLAQGVRFAPFCAALSLSTWCRIPASCHQSAACHGVPLLDYLWRVGLPRMFPTLITCGIIAGLLTAADVPSTMLMAPPGSITLPGRLFTVMDNASERMVASLCFAYLAAGLIAALVLYLCNSRRWRLFA